MYSFTIHELTRTRIHSFMHCSCVRTRVLNDFCLLLAHGCGCFLANAGLINEQGRFDRSHAKMLAQAEGKVATPAALTLLTKRLKKLRTVVSQSRDKWIAQVTQLSGTDCVHAAIVTGAFAGCGACFVCRPPLCPNPAMPVGDCCCVYRILSAAVASQRFLVLGQLPCWNPTRRTP